MYWTLRSLPEKKMSVKKKIAVSATLFFFYARSAGGASYFFSYNAAVCSVVRKKITFFSYTAAERSSVRKKRMAKQLTQARSGLSFFFLRLKKLACGASVKDQGFSSFFLP